MATTANMVPTPLTHAATMPLDRQGGNGNDGVSTSSLMSPGIKVELFQGQHAASGAAAAGGGGGGIGAGIDDGFRPVLAHAR